jgi:hypothetical protein
MFAIVALVVGALLLLAGFAVPTCQNYAGTARDSGYPCKIDRSSGNTDFVLSRTSTISVPLTKPLAIGLAIGLVLLGGFAWTRSLRPR